jgi:hypothetical protein
LPAPLPPQDPRLREFLDTVEVTRELRLAIDAQSQRLRSVESENVLLRQQIVDLRLAARLAVDSITAYHIARYDELLRVNRTLERGMAAAAEEADEWERAFLASRVTWGTRLLYSAIGAGVTALVYEVALKDEGTSVVVQAGDYGHSVAPPYSGPLPVGCKNGRRKRIGGIGGGC